MGRKIAAIVVALLVIVFPFRKAFLSHDDPGLMMMISFILTLAGIVLFYFLTLQPNKNQH